MMLIIIGVILKHFHFYLLFVNNFCSTMRMISETFFHSCDFFAKMKVCISKTQIDERLMQ